MAAENPGQSARESTGQAAGEVHVDAGACFVYFAHDVGFAIDLEQARPRLTAATSRRPIPHRRRAPQHFDYTPAPLQIVRTRAAVGIAAFRTDELVEATIFDFGAVSVRYRIPLAGPLDDLRNLSDELYDNAELRGRSRALVEELVNEMGSALSKPRISELVEDYAIYQVERMTPPITAARLGDTCGLELAQILRSEVATLSGEEVTEALSTRISYGPADATIVDWNAALVIDPDADEVRAVLEFANVQLLELRYLDDQLDEDLEEAYATMTKQSWRAPLFRTRRRDLRRLAALQMDSAMMFEGVNNALKLLGDPYLARVYRLAANRFHLKEWDANILRKLDILDHIYGRVADQQANLRLELLEWIIIVLIAVSIVLPFLPGTGH